MIVSLLITLVLADLSSCLTQISPCSKNQTLIPSFTDTTDGSVDYSTKAHVCHNDTHMVFKWFSVDQQIISTYEQCNDPLYTQDAVQVFVAKFLNQRQRQAAIYYEFQVSPKGVLFFADIRNPEWRCYNLGTKYFPCNYAKYSAQITQTGWNAELAVSIDILNRGNPGQTFYINLFRIDKSSNKPTRYLSWKPTMTQPACFHMPKFFQEVILKN